MIVATVGYSRSYQKFLLATDKLIGGKFNELEKKYRALNMFKITHGYKLECIRDREKILK